MKNGALRKLRWFHILILAVGALLLVSLSPVYPARVYSTDEDITLVALTFDDGYNSWVSEAMPILAEYGLTATGYIRPTEYGETYTWEDVGTLYDAGWEIGWHTVEHTQVDV